MKKIISISAFVLFPLITFCQTNWKAYSGQVVFKIKNAGVTVTGRFSGLKAGLLFSPDKLASSFLTGTVEVGTIKTGIDKRDEDLKAEKYFDEGKHKLIELKSVKLYKKGSQYAGLFNVTIKGVTKQIEIPFEYSEHGSEVEFKGNFTINRRDFGIGGKTLTMSESVDISIEVKAKS